MIYFNYIKDTVDFVLHATATVQHFGQINWQQYYQMLQFINYCSLIEANQQAIHLVTLFDFNKNN